MNEAFRIEKRKSFRVLGYTIKTTNKRNEARKAIPEHWASFKKNNLEESLLSLNDQEPIGLLGINVYNTNEDDSRQFEYYIAASSHHEVTSELSEYIIPEAQWAVFPCTIDSIGRTEALAITKWLPKSKYKALNKGYLTGRMKSAIPDIEYYGKDDLVEVWVAVKEK